MQAGRKECLNLRGVAGKFLLGGQCLDRLEMQQPTLPAAQDLPPATLSFSSSFSSLSFAFLAIW